jgi:hypothetical protein
MRPTLKGLNQDCFSNAVATHSGLGRYGMITQGSSFLATGSPITILPLFPSATSLGWMIKRRWRFTPAELPKVHNRL